MSVFKGGDEKTTAVEEVEDIILQSSIRGMDALRRHLPSRFCRRAAQDVFERERGNVFILTGFYVNGFAETDGPIGAHFLGKALDSIGFHSMILTDSPYQKFFNRVIGVPVQKSAAQKCLESAMETHRPICLISIERCGRDEKGIYRNLHGKDISSYTAPLDELFLKKDQNVLRIGIGDGGNEIGMGNLKHIMPKSLGMAPNFLDASVLIDIILRKKRGLIDKSRQHSFEPAPCIVEAEHVIISTVSNWGAYGMIAELSAMIERDLLPHEHEIEAYLDHILNLGAIDSFTGKSKPLVDGHSLDEDFKIIKTLRTLLKFNESKINFSSKIF